ncbi:hypothetical protein BCR33DRAFT_716911 [Rhizoclosmatium globosum]|uniref:VOC domain-containing protein n=1 Tax=Rhizoclosmatium globosum TaxID=329046 RepID=A0A1Y2CBU2_9FUNG|nr:hypothetical protein BCR33DRAFT_716911 [Rhizoclosmatium globosum]|eukprot:ORY44357.1 hypothetical protein BCR33DRAFT_716911 [Rhizoclosmatium globosum]
MHLLLESPSEKGQFTNYFLAFNVPDEIKNQPGNGYAHICIVVDDIVEYSAYLDAAGVPFRKRLTEGVMRNIAFVLDPDGYSVELIERRK